MASVRFIEENVKRLIRREWLQKFKINYVMHSIGKRKGHCLQCGKCCLNFCEHLDAKTMKCKIWDEHGREAIPLSCKLSPIDEKAQAEHLKGVCGFYWGEK